MARLAFKRFLSTNSTKINEVFIVSYARTPMGAFQGKEIHFIDSTTIQLYPIQS